MGFIIHFGDVRPFLHASSNGIQHIFSTLAAYSSYSECVVSCLRYLLRPVIVSLVGVSQRFFLLGSVLLLLNIIELVS